MSEIISYVDVFCWERKEFIELILAKRYFHSLLCGKYKYCDNLMCILRIKCDKRQRLAVFELDLKATCAILVVFHSVDY